jgi:hypothetical protein
MLSSISSKNQKKKNKKKKQAPRPLARLSSRVARASAYCAIARTIQSYDGEYRTQRPEKQSTAKDKRRQQGNGYGPPRLLLPTRSVQVCALRSEWSRGVVSVRGQLPSSLREKVLYQHVSLRRRSCVVCGLDRPTLAA